MSRIDPGLPAERANYSSPPRGGGRRGVHAAVLLGNLESAGRSLRSGGYRTALAMLGVAIGVTCVIVLVAIGEGASLEIKGQIDTLGTNVAVVVPGKTQGQKNFNPFGGMGISNLTPDDLRAVELTPGVRRTAPVAFLAGAVFQGDRPASICLPLATSPDLAPIRRLDLAAGRFLTAEDADERRCVLGAGIARDLFPETPAGAVVGREVQLNAHSYRVVGVLRARTIGSGMLGGEELDAILYVPILQAHLDSGTRQIHRIFFEVEPSRDPETVVQSVKNALLARHGGRDDISILGARELLAMFFKIFNILSALLVGITAVSLVVGAIGVMNVMLATVTERTREIGIRKTVGARPADIFWQFLSEAVVITLAGGGSGLFLSALICLAVRVWTPLEPTMTAASIALAIGICGAVGLLSGVLPATAAARKNPIDAVRHE